MILETPNRPDSEPSKTRVVVFVQPPEFWRVRQLSDRWLRGLEEASACSPVALANKIRMMVDVSSRCSPNSKG
jgi:hypothetical protein